jgi:hypothetical protein
MTFSKQAMVLIKELAGLNTIDNKESSSSLTQVKVDEGRKARRMSIRQELVQILHSLRDRRA